MEVLFVAVENGGIEGGKVGGIGDVIRDLPPALAALGCRVTVVIPSHGYLHLGLDSTKIGACRFLFRGELQTADIFEVFSPNASPGVTQLVIHHPALSAVDASSGAYHIYTHDPPDRPFFTDGSRFAFFSAAVVAAVSRKVIGTFDIIHLHDWHAGLVALLGRFHPDFSAIQNCRSVFSIHNLAFQGVRPLRGSVSSLEAWFPGLRYDWATVADPRWPDCINLMAVGIRLANRVHTVSPAYARDIRQPSRKPQFYGGEGLEADLEQVHREGRLIGILNGCCYPRNEPGQRVSFDDLLNLIRREAIRWSGDGDAVPAAQFVAVARTLDKGDRHEDPDVILTSVARVGEQKMLLLRQNGSKGKSALHEILEGIGPRGCYILLGSGDRDYERFFTTASARYENFIFVNGYSENCAKALYAAGDLYLMPSSFEPCGLSQMLAMREGQPCLVHAVGGLKDTVDDGRNGFTFSGDTVEKQAEGFVRATLEAVALKRQNPAAWGKIRKNAAATRFRWEETADRYVQELYR